MSNLTTRQREILDWIAAFIRDRGHSPTRQEVAKQFGYSGHEGTRVHLIALRRKGCLDWNRCQPRTFVVLRTA